MMIDRSTAPEFNAPGKFLLPKPEIINFNNGSRLFLLNVGDQPVITLEFIFRSGVWFEASAGQSFFTAKMLMEGTKSFTSAQIAERLDFYGAFAEVQPGFDFVNLAFHLPVRHLDKILDIIAEVLFEPVFPENEFELMKQIQLQQLLVSMRKNNFLASRHFRSTLYQGNPYGHILTEEAIDGSEIKTLTRFYNNRMHGRFDIFLSGKFDDAIPAILEQRFSARMMPMNMFHGLPFPESDLFDVYLEKADSLQTAIFMGGRCINRSHPDYPAVLLLNEVFGGYFGSRLMQNIREDKGYTYGIHSQMSHMKQDSYFVISTEVKKETHRQALKEIASEIEKVKNTEIFDAELEEARNHLKGSILNTLTSPMAVSEKLKKIYFYELPDDYYNLLFDGIDAATPSQLMQLANTTLFNKPFSVVSAG